MTSPPIAITGMHRSGTSMVTRGLHEAGLSLLGGDDALIDPADDNPEGFWENKRIVACNDELLEAAGGSWDNPPALLPQAVDDPRFASIADRATDALAGLRHHDRWGFKDPRTCLTAAYWLDLEPDLRFIVCVRHPLEVALSLRRRNQTSYSLGLSLWEQYYRAALALIPTDRRIVSHYDTFFIDPDGEFGRLCDFAELQPATAPVRTDLRHHTIGVSLADAGVNDSLIELYHTLCAEAGNPQPPEPPTDEGRVRRLILDGAVAERHAEQRQEAIERHEVRELEFRAEIADLRREKAALESDLRNRLRRVEAQLAATRKTAITRAELRSQLQPLTEANQAINAVDAVLRQTAGRIEVVAANTRPGPLRRVLRRGGRLAYQGGRRYAFRPTRIATQKGRRTALPHAKAAARTLPPGAQRVLRQGRRTVYRARQRFAGLPPATTDEPTTSIDQHAPSTPPSVWLPDYAALVARAVPAGAAALVLDHDGTVDTDDEHRFPRAGGADLGAIAELETRRYEGHDWLAVPEGSRDWLAEHRTFRDHILGRYHTAHDEPGAGLIVDLGRRSHDATTTLKGEILRLTAGASNPPAVLDWTDLDISRDLGGFTVFTAPEGEGLLYLDDSVEVVVTDRSADRGEAARVASVAVVTVEVGPTGTAEVHSIEAQSEIEPPPAASVLVVGDADSDDQRWREQLRESSIDAGAQVRFAELSATALDAMTDLGDFTVVVLVEQAVVPLPGSIEAATTAALASPDRAVTGKVVRGDGELESAGGTVFADRSVGLIAGGSADLRAPWHEYNRPVCWGAGLVAASGGLWQRTARPAHVTGRAYLREWCAEVWAGGAGVDYTPTVTAVRVTGDGGEPPGPLHESSWQRVLDLRPDRPAELDDGAWRFVLAHDDVEACRG